MPECRFKSVPFVEVKAEADGSGFSGYCSVFHNMDSYGDIVVPGACPKTIGEFLANGMICYNHKVAVGRPVEAFEDEKGLFVRGTISDTTTGRDCKTLLRDGVVRKMSIGYQTLEFKRMNPDSVSTYWQEKGYNPTSEDMFNLGENMASGLRCLTSIKLYEASPVDFPANTEAVITTVKQFTRMSDIKATIEMLKSGKCMTKAMHDYLSSLHDTMRPTLDDLKSLLDTHGAVIDEISAPDVPKSSDASRLALARAKLGLLSMTKGW